MEPAFFDTQALQEDLVNRYFDMLRAPGVRQAIIDRSNQTINTDPAERLKRITAPTLLLWGQADQMIPSDNAKSYELVLPHYKTVVLPKQGHLIQEERPQEGLHEVTQFLESAL
jgi:pimeloyl-ACP methyl ester carboxylesterase